MPPTGPDDRQERARRGLPPGVRDDSPPEPTPRPDEDAAPTAAEAVGETADPDATPSVHPDSAAPDTPRGEGSRPPQSWESGAYPGQSPPQSPKRYDRFGWPVPADVGSDESDARPPTQGYTPRDSSSWRVPRAPDVPPRAPYSGQFPAQQPAPNQSPRGPYSGQFPAQPPPRQSGAFPAARDDERAYRESAAFPATPPEQVQRSGAFPIQHPLPPNVARSGQFAVPPAPGGPDDRRSGAYAVPPEPRTGGYPATASGPIPQSPYSSGPMPRVGEQPDTVPRSGPFAYPAELTSTGSRRVIVAPDAGVGSLLADRQALAFLVAAVVLAGAMIAYIALRYAHFPDQIALHFGPAGSSQPNRIGEKRELWTIPFIVGIVLAANTALAWAVYRYDRFAARLLTVGCALVAAIAWVVLLTLLHR